MRVNSFSQNLCFSYILTKKRKNPYVLNKPKSGYFFGYTQKYVNPRGFRGC